jgi:hypothetical protein
LRELVAEKKIRRLSNLYYIINDDDFEFTLLFSSYVGIMLGQMLERKDVLDGLSEERAIFEFSNMIGSIITYMLIQSKRPCGSDVEYSKKAALTDLIFEEPLDFVGVSHAFGRLFENIPTDMPYEGLSKEKFTSMCKSFKKVYPDLYKSFEDGWRMYCIKFIRIKPMNDIYKNCTHEWQRRTLFNFGEYLQCLRCGYRKEAK